MSLCSPCRSFNNVEAQRHVFNVLSRPMIAGRSLGMAIRPPNARVNLNALILSMRAVMVRGWTAAYEGS